MSEPEPQPMSLLGAPIQVTTTFGAEIEGELFCYDACESQSIVIRSKTPDGRTVYKWVCQSGIKEVKAMGPPRATDEVLPALDLRQADERLAAAEAEAVRLSATWGVGVTEAAQEVFNTLSKTMECEWDKEDIICLGVRVTPPYTSKSCTSGDPKALSAVKKVLEGERDRLERKLAASSTRGDNCAGEEDGGGATDAGRQENNGGLSQQDRPP
mmetsp:Transcript_87607/g.196134  ORF Transcript_87607/g.196134 Transcript_87607/m.196134 type:complete len:213 (-) Transcript_87607:69-707(-)